jgi:Tfp pilus assembly protein PilO
MGKYGQIKDYPEFYALPNKDALSELKMLCESVTALREQMPDDSELENLLDNIESLIDSTMYKVKFLK